MRRGRHWLAGWLVLLLPRSSFRALLHNRMKAWRRLEFSATDQLVGGVTAAAISEVRLAAFKLSLVPLHDGSLAEYFFWCVLLWTTRCSAPVSTETAG